MYSIFVCGGGHRVSQYSNFAFQLPSLGEACCHVPKERMLYVYQFGGLQRLGLFFYM